MLDQEEYDGLEYYFNAMSAPSRREKELAEVERLVEERLAKARSDPDRWSADNARGINRGFGHRAVKFLINHHPESRRLSREDRSEIFALAAGKPSPELSGYLRGVGMDADKKKMWHERIQRWLPVLKVIATFTPVPYNFAVIGLIVLLVIIDENRLKPFIVEAVFMALAVGGEPEPLTEEPDDERLLGTADQTDPGLPEEVAGPHRPHAGTAHGRAAKGRGGRTAGA